MESSTFAPACLRCARQIGDQPLAGLAAEGGELDCPHCGEAHSYTILDGRLVLKRVSVPPGTGGPQEKVFDPLPKERLGAARGQAAPPAAAEQKVSLGAPAAAEPVKEYTDVAAAAQPPLEHVDIPVGAAQAEAPAAGAAPTAAAVADIEEQIRKIICEKLSVKPEQVMPATSFVNDLGADSLDQVELVMEFEDKFGVQIPDEDAEKIQTVGDAINYIQAHKT